jgi:hypothetical protein
MLDVEIDAEVKLAERLPSENYSVVAELERFFFEQEVYKDTPPSFFSSGT